jgi:Trypsin-like peptidase domain
MEFDINQFVQELEYSLNVFDVSNASSQCDRLISFLIQSDESVPLAKAEKILQLLRNKRMFAVMQKVADTLLQTGRNSYKIQRQYAQSLIDSGNYTAAIYILQNLITTTSGVLPPNDLASSENAEAKGLVGRAYKQLYVNAKNASNPKCIEYITFATTSYYQVYSADKTKNWHGINTVALLERAKRDKIQLSLCKDPLQLAEEILNNIQIKYNSDNADAWDFATAAEACVALSKPKEALQWLSGYARMPYCDAFELSSTLRQLEEVWQMDLSSEMGQYLLPLLRSELIKRKGSNLTMDIAEIKKQKSIDTIVSEKYDSLIENKNTDGGTQEVKLEKIFGDDSFKTYKWYMQGADRCLAVGRIGKDSTKGFGTGFLLKGKDLNEGFGEELILLTNAHVVSADPTEKSLRPEEAIVIFEALDSSEEFRDLEIIWSSPSDKLDATVLRFSRADHNRLKELTQGLKLYPISKYLPAVETPPTQKVYVIGHPHGGTLQISFQDNLLIDHDKISKIHYRTPTEGGSSGSPVFNQQWDLIGLHHAGSETMKCLNDKPGTYQANEGIWIQRIIKELGSGYATGAIVASR